MMSLAGCGRVRFEAAPVDGALDTAKLTYRNAVVADAPLAYWRLGAGAIARDEMGRFDGMFGGVCTSVSGLIAGDSDSAILFDGASCSVSVGMQLDFPGTAPYSIEAWFSKTPGGNNYQNLFSRETRNVNPIDGYALLVAKLPPAGLYLERVVSTQNRLTNRFLPVDNTTIHAVGVYTGSEMQLWQDGVLLTTLSDTRVMATSNARALIGAGFDASISQFFNGTLDEVAIYDKALTIDQIKLHHEVGTLGPREQ
ncbi:MAG: Autotransporter adhesin [Myxococcales bacterium]|nr:Autotransporter adhesin [Myxococcales bacterium]